MLSWISGNKNFHDEIIFIFKIISNKINWSMKGFQNETVHGRFPLSR